MTREETDKLILFLKSAYSNAQLSKDVSSALYIILKPYSYETARTAAMEHARSCVYLPTAAELATRCERIQPTAKSADGEEHTAPRELEEMKRYLVKLLSGDTEFERLCESNGVPPPTNGNYSDELFEKWLGLCRARRKRT